MIVPPASRNDPCPCGSGLRYKHCHGRAERNAAPPANAARGSDNNPAAEVDDLRSARRALAAGRLDAAIAIAERALAVDPQRIDAMRVRGEALTTIDPQRAEACWHAVQARIPGDAEAAFHLGNLARSAGRIDEAVTWLELAQRGAPAHVGVMNNLGLALEAAGRIADAEPVFRRALAAAPNALEPLANLAQNLYQQRRHADALPHFDTLLARMPDAPATIWANRSVCLSHLGRLDEAGDGLRRALAFAPGEVSLLRDLGMHALRTKRFDEAVEVLARAVALEPAHALTQSLFLAAELNTARWDRFDAAAAGLIEAARSIAERPGQSLSAFDFAVICDDPVLQREAARSWTRAQTPVATARTHMPGRTRTGRLRLGFVSSDLYNHPVGRLLVALVEHLDRTRYDVALYSVAAPAHDAFTRRFEAAATIFRSVAVLDPATLAARIRADAVDILFDMNGLTGLQFAALFALRPAPVQAQFIGYTGTMGATSLDWIIADRNCIEDGERAHYDEAPVHVEPCYLPSDTGRTLSTETLRRADYGLPDDAIVFCAFAPLYKVLPPMFARWMQLLARHAGSVLWLRGAPTAVVARLRAAAATHGIDAARLVFAADEPHPRYLARMRLADLFIDTFPYGAHTTVNDALYAGLPVVTQRGRSFASRASASQVAAMGCARTIAHDADAYVAVADTLAGDRAQREAIAASLRDPAARAALFDMDRYARAFEAAIDAAWGAAVRG
jgi:predicted O-linked N-acetylglucosamine transferase (SPINDLY family)